MMRRYIRIPMALTCGAVLACTLTSKQPTPEVVLPTALVEPTGMSPPTPTDTPPDPNAFQGQLEQALIAEDYNTLRSLMRDAFAVGYWQSEGGVIAIDDAINLLRDDFLSGPDPVSFDPDVNPADVLGYDPVSSSPDTVRVIFSAGWGSNGQAQAVLSISTAPDGSLYWSSILYAPEGFEAGEQPGDEVAFDTPTPIVPAQTPSRPTFGDLIYESDFSAGWFPFDEENGTSGHVTGGYQMNVIQQALWTYSTRVSESTFYAEVEATPSQCPVDQAAYGMIFHYRDSTHFRFFIVWCGGRYSLFQRDTANSVFVIDEGILLGGVNPASGSHVLGVRVVNNTAALYVDDFQLSTVALSDMPKGDVGPYVETTGAPISVLYTRLSVYEPD